MGHRSMDEQIPYNARYSRTIPVTAGDLETIQMALATADDFMLWLTVIGGYELPSGATQVKNGLEKARALSLELCRRAIGLPDSATGNDTP